MILPLGTNRTSRRQPVVTAAIVLAQVFVYVVLSARGGDDPHRQAELVREWGFTGFGRPLGLLTHHWIHTGVFGLVMDGVFIVIMGMVVEDRLGHLGTLLLYLAAGAASASVQHLTAGAGAGVGAGVGQPPIIGAGGAGAALIGAFIVFAPGAMVRLLLLFPVMSVVEIPAGWFIAAAVLKDVWFNAGGSAAGVTVLGTMTGYALGFALALVLVWTGVVAKENFDLLHLLRQRRRLSEIREAARAVRSRETHLGRAASGESRGLGAVEAGEACVAARSRLAEASAGGDWAGAAAAFRAFCGAAGSGVGRPVLNRRAHLETAASLLQAGLRAEAAEVFARFVEDHPRDAEGPHVRLLLGVLRARHLGDPNGARAAVEGLESASLGADDQSILEDLRRELGGPVERKAADDGTNAHQDLRGEGR